MDGNFKNIKCLYNFEEMCNNLNIELEAFLNNVGISVNELYLWEFGKLIVPNHKKDIIAKLLNIKSSDIRFIYNRFAKDVFLMNLLN